MSFAVSNDSCRACHTGIFQFGVRVRVTEECDQITGCVETSSAWRTAVSVQWARSTRMPSRLHSCDDLAAELGQPVVLRRLGLEVAQRVLDVVHELHAAHAELVGALQRLRSSSSTNVAPSTVEHDMRLAGERPVDVVRGQRDLELLRGDVLLDAGEIVLEPSARLAGLGQALLLDALRR